MIFVTVGTQRFQFDRLFREIDLLIKKKVITERVIAQIGVSTYTPKNYYYVNYLKPFQFNKYLSECDLMITHAGTSSIIHGLTKGKKVIVVPRRKKYEEHIDDHQVEIANTFKKNNYVAIVDDIRQLASTIKEVRKSQFSKFRSNNTELVESIRSFIKDQLV